MTNKNRYTRLRNGNVESGGLPPHYFDEKKKEVVFHLKSVIPAQMAIPNWMKKLSLAPDWKGVVVRCEETFYKLRTRVKETRTD